MLADSKMISQRWRKEYGYTGKGGVVVIFRGTVQGWVNGLRNPEHWQAGCVALDEAGNVWEARGGDSQNGAALWQEVPMDDSALGAPVAEVNHYPVLEMKTGTKTLEEKSEMKTKINLDGFKTLTQLAKKKLYPLADAEIIVFRGRNYARESETETRLTMDGWLKVGRAVKISEDADENAVYSMSQTELALSVTEWGQRGKKVRPGSVPAGTPPPEAVPRVRAN